jgi:nitronate monooxygenase
MLIRAKPQMVSFHFGLPPQEVLDAIKDAGIFMISSATTIAEARMLEAAGVDAIIAQGTEAGGHRGTFIGVDISMQPGLSALLPQVIEPKRRPNPAMQSRMGTTMPAPRNVMHAFLCAAKRQCSF